MTKTILKVCGILAIAAMVFVNTHYSFDDVTSMDVNLAFFEKNLEAYADENGDNRCSFCVTPTESYPYPDPNSELRGACTTPCG